MCKRPRAVLQFAVFANRPPKIGTIL